MSGLVRRSGAGKNGGEGAARRPERCRHMSRERLARYSLAGPENRAAVDAGLAGGD